MLKDKLPTCKRIVAALSIFYFHTVVVASIIIFLTMLIFMQHNLINAISQLIILIMLKIYLDQGIKSMVQYWPILVFYQSIILCILVVYYFLIQSALN